MNNEKKFHHAQLKVPKPEWGSPLVGNIIELEKLRERRFIPYNLDIFFDLKAIFDQFENWASARIEGNQTRLLDAVDPGVRSEVVKTTDYQELQNLRAATAFIDEYCKENNQITKAFILEVHKIVTQNLPVGQNYPGDDNPGAFRHKDVEITKSSHVPPLGVKVGDYMEELVEFANYDDGKQFYLLKLAILHHRFTWIHPFGNGNGRLARLLTYASLQMMGYGASKWRIINPAIVFYTNRELYYKKLSVADNGSAEGLLEWADYFLEGLLRETNKIDRLSDGQYVVEKIIKPTLKDALEASRIGSQEYAILKASLTHREDMNIVAGDLDSILGEKKTPVSRSRILASLRKNGLIKPAWNSKQKYVIQLTCPVLIRHLVYVFEQENFINEDVNKI
ncbi:MAG: Fic family protein [Candidatus Woesebacteria bacterium]|jgi:Fic family protein